MEKYIITFKDSDMIKSFDTLHEALGWARKYKGSAEPDTLFFGDKNNKRYIGSFKPIEDEED